MINLSINSPREFQFSAVVRIQTVLEAARKLNIKIRPLCNIQICAWLGNVVFASLSRPERKPLLPHAPCRQLKDGYTDEYIIRVRNVARKHDRWASSVGAPGQIARNATKTRNVSSRHWQMNLHSWHYLSWSGRRSSLYTIWQIISIIYKGWQQMYPVGQRCVRTCTELQYISAIAVANKDCIRRSPHSITGLWAMLCVQIAVSASTAVLPELLLRKHISTRCGMPIYDSDKHVVVQTAPAVRVALGEDLGYDPGWKGYR